MTELDKRSVDLSEEDAALVDRLVSRGEYGSAEEAVSAAISTLRTEDADFERWLREEVVPVAEELARHPERAIPAEEVFKELKARYSTDGRRDS